MNIKTAKYKDQLFSDHIFICKTKVSKLSAQLELT